MKKLIFLLGVFVFVVLCVVGWFINGLAPAGNDKTLRRFVVDPGENATQIGVDLQRQGFVKNVLAFRVYSQVTQAAVKIKPGLYDLPSNLWTPQIVDKLLAGPTEIWVTIPEGLRREEIVQKFVEGFELSGKQADSFSSEFLSLTKNKEGFLFPDTYLFARDATAGQVFGALTKNFDTKYESVRQSQTVNFSQTQIINIASIVQREAISQSDMQGVASVLENRLDIGMALGSDVTLEYALGFQKDSNSWWKEDLTVDDLALNSLYNTRIYAGLPPTPISNPGLVAIQAAMNPPQTNYLYYLSDSSGKLHFATTLEEHNANIARYLQ